MAFNAGAVTGEIILRYDKAVRALKTVEQQTKRSMGKMAAYVQKNQEGIRQAGMGMVKVGAAMSAAFGLAVRQASLFEAEMRNANSIMKVSEDQFVSLSNEVVELSRRLPQTADVLAQGLYQLASGGIAAADSMDVLEAAATAAVAGVSDTATAATALIAVLNTYELAGTDAARVSDVLFKTVEKGVITFGELAGSIGMVISSAAPAGITLEEVSAAMVVMTRAGFNAAMSSTALARIMETFLSPSKEFAKALKQIGIEDASLFIRTKGLAAAIDALNKVASGTPALLAAMGIEKRALRAAMALTRGEGALFNEMLGEMEDAVGATTKAFEEQSKSFAVQWDLFKSSINALLITVGQKLLPMLRQKITAIQEIVDGLTTWAGANDKLATSLVNVTAKLGLLTVAVGILLMTLPNLTKGGLIFGGMLKGLVILLSGPAGIVVGLGALAYIIRNIVRDLQPLEIEFADTADELQRLQDLTVEEAESMRSLAERAQELAGRVGKTAKEYKELDAIRGKMAAAFPDLLRRYGTEEEAARSLTRFIDLLNESQVERLRLWMRMATLIQPIEERTIKVIKTQLDDVTHSIEKLTKQMLDAGGAAAVSDAEYDRLHDTLDGLREVQGDLTAELLAAREALKGKPLTEAQLEALRKLREEMAETSQWFARFTEDWREMSRGAAEAMEIRGPFMLGGAMAGLLPDVRRNEAAFLQWERDMTNRLLLAQQEITKELQIGLAGVFFEPKADTGPGSFISAFGIPDEERMDNIIRSRQKVVEDALENAVDTTKDTADEIARIWAHMWERVQDIFADAIYGLITATSNLGDFIKSVWDAVLRAISQRIAAAVVKWIAEFNKVKEATKEIGGDGGKKWWEWIPDIIPFLQHGGIVTKPTVAMIGEKGPEAVIPLGRATPALAGAGMGGNVTINQYLSVDALDERGLRKLYRRSTNAIGHEMWRAGFRSELL